MTRRYEDFCEDDAFDENGLLRGVTDGSGKCDEFAFSRPGFRILADAAINDARETAYQEYLDYISDAWRTKPSRV